MGQFNDSVNYFKIAEEIYSLLYSKVHPKTCKVKRNIALLYIKLHEHEKALQELFEIETLERAIHGDSSVHLGKTLKIIGTIYLMMNK